MKNIVDAPMSVDKISKAEAYDRADKLLKIILSDSPFANSISWVTMIMVIFCSASSLITFNTLWTPL